MMTDYVRPALLSERRFKILRMSPRIMVDILNWWRVADRKNYFISMPVCDEIPHDVEVVSLQPDWQSSSIEVLLYHPSWPQVTEGERFPEITGYHTEFRNVPFKHVSEESTRMEHFKT